MTREQENGGKGMSRVEIAERAVARKKAEFMAALGRLREAKAAAKAAEAKGEERGDKKRNAAARALLRLGMTGDQIAEVLVGQGASEDEAVAAIAEARRKPGQKKGE